MNSAEKPSKEETPMEVVQRLESGGEPRPTDIPYLLSRLRESEARVGRLLIDPVIEAATKAIAWEDLTPKGRAECRWPDDFSERERLKYRNQAIMALEAARAALDEKEV